MARGIQIPFTLDVREWRRGIRVVEVDLDGLADELRDLEKAGDQAEKALEDNFRDIGRAAERAGQDVSTGMGRGMKGRLGSVGAEVGDEFVESWGEAVRSGDLSGAVTETVSNAAMIGMAAGPVGAAVGIGVSALVGIITAQFQARKQQFEEAVAGLVSINWEPLVVEAGLAGQRLVDAVTGPFRTAELDEGRIAAALNVDEPAKAWERIGQLVEDTGLSVSTVTNAVLGNESAVAAVNAAYAEQKDRLDQLGPPGAARTAETVAARKALEESVSALGQLKTTAEASVASAQTLRTAAEARAAAERGAQPAVRDIMTNLGLAAGYANNMDAALARAGSRRITIPVGIDAAGFRRSVYAATAGLPSYVTDALLND